MTPIHLFDSRFVSTSPRGLRMSWVEPDDGVHDWIDPYWIDFEMILVPHVRKRKWRMWVDHGVEFFIHPAMQARAMVGFPEFFRQDRDGCPGA